MKPGFMWLLDGLEVSGGSRHSKAVSECIRNILSPPGQCTMVKGYASIYNHQRANLPFLVEDLGFSVKENSLLAGQLQSQTHDPAGNGS